MARRGRAGQAFYVAAKAVVGRLSESLADEVRDFGIAVNILEPGWDLTKPSDDIAEAAIYMALQTPDTMTCQPVSAPEYDMEHGITLLSSKRRRSSVPCGRIDASYIKPHRSQHRGPGCKQDHSPREKGLNGKLHLAMDSHPMLVRLA